MLSWCAWQRDPPPVDDAGFYEPTRIPIPLLLAPKEFEGGRIRDADSFDYAAQPVTEVFASRAIFVL
jgi:hypothetical protein